MAQTVGLDGVLFLRDGEQLGGNEVIGLSDELVTVEKEVVLGRPVAITRSKRSTRSYSETRYSVFQVTPGIEPL